MMLKVCRDRDNDGRCDEPLSKTKTISMDVPIPGALTVCLAGPDKGGLTHSMTHQVTVKATRRHHQESALLAERGEDQVEGR